MTVSVWLPRLVVTLIVFAAATPVLGWMKPTVWIGVMVLLVLGEQASSFSTKAKGQVAGVVKRVFEFLTSITLALTAFYLISQADVSEKIVAATLYGVVMFGIIVRDYADWRRMIVNLSPMILSIAAVQILSIWYYVARHEPAMILVVVATPALLGLTFMSLQRDLSQSRRQILAGRKAAEAAAEAKAEFLANMSHEIRTPLTGVIGFSSLLSDMPGLPEEAQAHIRRIVAGGANLLAVVNDILDFSKIESGHLELDPQPFQVASFLDTHCSLFEHAAHEKGLALERRISPRVPAVLLADSLRLGQIVSNLVSNAIKFTSQGSVCVDLDYHEDLGRLVVSVADTGDGIAAEVLGRLFTRFTQADGSISRKHGGTGLGLSICKSLAELMGGDLNAVSELGSGSVFSLAIPAPSVEDGEPGLCAMAPVEDAPDGHPKEILVVDDLEANRELIKVILESIGHHITLAVNGEDAIGKAACRRFDLILMDLQMPGVDGFAATQAIRRSAGENASTPIVALSANVLAEHKRVSAEVGMNDHLMKPIVVPLLVEAVARWSVSRVEPRRLQGVT